MNNSEIILYQNADGNIKIDVHLEAETVWLTQDQMATLFGKGRSTVAEHILNVYKEGELVQEATCRKFRQVRNEGIRSVDREIDHFNLDVIISVGYRVKSPQGTQFRIWASKILREFIIKGFVLDDDRLKQGQRFGKDYFDELLERIREIRVSERRFYLKITDIYEQCSIDYSHDAEITQTFFKTVQNKLHFAISGKTAARSSPKEPVPIYPIWDCKPGKMHPQAKY